MPLSGTKKGRRGTRADRAAAKAAKEFGAVVKTGPAAGSGPSGDGEPTTGSDVHVLHIVRGLPGSGIEHYAAKLAHEAEQAGLKVAVFGTPIDVAGGSPLAARDFRYKMRREFRKALKTCNVVVMYDNFPKKFMYEGYILDCKVPKPEYDQTFGFAARVHRVDLGPVPSLALARQYASNQDVFSVDDIIAMKLSFEMDKDEVVFDAIKEFVPT